MFRRRGLASRPGQRLAEVGHQTLTRGGRLKKSEKGWCEKAPLRCSKGSKHLGENSTAQASSLCHQQAHLRASRLAHHQNVFMNKTIARMKTFSSESLRETSSGCLEQDDRGSGGDASPTRFSGCYFGFGRGCLTLEVVEAVGDGSRHLRSAHQFDVVVKAHLRQGTAAKSRASVHSSRLAAKYHHSSLKAKCARFFPGKCHIGSVILSVHDTPTFRSNFAGKHTTSNGRARDQASYIEVRDDNGQEGKLRGRMRSLDARCNHLLLAGHPSLEKVVSAKMELRPPANRQRSILGVNGLGAGTFNDYSGDQAGMLYSGCIAPLHPK